MSNTNNATNQIGLEKADMSEVIDKLNDLLSSYHMFYINVRGYHWNVKGEHFFTLHPQFEELYTNLQVEIDEIAERILTLGGTPLHAYSDFSQHTNIQEDKNVKDGNACVQGVVTGLQALIEEQREVSALAERAEDKYIKPFITQFVY